MKKILSLVLSVLMLSACFVATPVLAASKDLKTVDFSIAYGTVWLYDQREASQNTLEAMVDLGISSKKTDDTNTYYDLDKDGKYDLIFDVNENYAKCDKTNITGQWDYTVPQKVKDALIAKDKDYVSRYLITFDNSCPKGGEHKWVEGVKKATFGKDGCTYAKCTKCGKEETGFPIVPVYAEFEKSETFTYDGKAKTPKVKVYTMDGPLPDDYYDIKYLNNVAVGTASVKITLKTKYYEGTKVLNFKITGKMPKNTLTAKGKKVTLKAKKLAKKKAVIKRKKAINVTKAKGSVTYAKVANKKTKNFTVNEKNGNITVKKGTKKGTYKVKIKVTAAGNNNFGPKTQKVTVTIIVK